MYTRHGVLSRALLTNFHSGAEDTKWTRAPMLWIFQQHLNDMMIRPANRSWLATGGGPGLCLKGKDLGYDMKVYSDI